MTTSRCCVNMRPDKWARVKGNSVKLYHMGIGTGTEKEISVKVLADLRAAGYRIVW